MSGVPENESTAGVPEVPDFIDAAERALHAALAGDDTDELLAAMPEEMSYKVRELLSVYRRFGLPHRIGPTGRNNGERSNASTGPADGSWLGQRIGAFEIQAIIGRGGMGTVYLAEQDSPRRQVALKLMRRNMASPSALRRFEFEAQALARLHHPNVAHVFDAGVHSGEAGEAAYFAMEYVEGAATIVEYADEHDLELRERVRLFTKVCKAVHHGHLRGIIHRDLKPDNILVDASGHPKVIDFGVARATDTDVAMTTIKSDIHQLVGTLRYMSPEQGAGDSETIDTRTDVYSLGIVLYELLTGLMPYEVPSSSTLKALDVIRGAPPKRPSLVNPRLRGDLQTIMLHALEKDRDRRYQSAADLAADLERWCRREPIVARGPSLTYHISLLMSRHRMGVALVAALILASVAGILYVFESREGARIARSRYRLTIGLAAAAVERSDVKAAGDYLANLPEEFRDHWEVSHLCGRTDLSVRTLITSPEGADGGSAQVSALAIDRQNRRLAVIRSGIRWGCSVLDIDAGQLLATLPLEYREEGAGNCKAVAFSPDGSILATAIGGDVAIWRSDGWLPVDRLKDRGNGQVEALAFSPDGRMLASGSSEGAITVWRSKSDVEPWILDYACDLKGHGKAAAAVEFSPNGDLIASAGYDDRTVRLWSVEAALSGDASEAEVACLEGHTYHVRDVAFDRRGTRLASAGIDSTVRFWDVQRSLEKREGHLLDVIKFGDRGLQAVVFANEDQIVFGGGEGTLGVTASHAGGPRRISALGGHHDMICRLETDGRGCVVSGSRDGAVKLWETSVRDIVTLEGHKSSVQGVGWLNDGRRIVSASIQGESGGKVVVWDAEDGNRVQVFTPTGLVERLAVCSRHGLVAGAVRVENAGVRAVVWDLETPPREATGSLEVSREGGRGALAVAISPDGQRLAFADGGGGVQVFSIDRRQGSLVHVENRLPGRTIRCLEFLDAAGQCLAVGAASTRSEDDLVILGIGWTQSHSYPAHAGAITDIAVHPDRTLLASASDDGTIRLWLLGGDEDGTPRLEPRGTVSGLRERFSSVAFHPAEHRLFSGARNGTVTIWDTTDSSAPERVVTLREHTGVVTALSFDPSSLSLASASGGSEGLDNVVKIWAGGVPKRLRRLRER